MRTWTYFDPFGIGILSRQSSDCPYTGLDWVRAGTTLNLIESSGLNHRTLGDIKSAGLISVSADGQPLMAERDYEVLSLDQIYALQPWKRVHLVIAVEPALTTHFFLLPCGKIGKKRFVTVRQADCMRCPVHSI